MTIFADFLTGKGIVAHIFIVRRMGRMICKNS